MIGKSLAIAAAMLAAAAATAQPLTLRQASALSDQALARRVLGEAGRLYVEAERPDPAELAPMGAQGLYFLNFATAPRWSGYAGICEADVAAVSLRPAPGARLRDRDPPARVEALSTARRFRIAGDPAAGSRRIEVDGDRQCSLCAGAGRVLGLEDGRTRFFQVRGGRGDASDASFAAIALRQALEAVRTGALVPTCSGGAPCPGAVAALSRFDVTRLTTVTVDRCAADAADLCVTAEAWHPGSTMHANISTIVRVHTDSATTETFRPMRIRGVATYALQSES
jgi:hypothetical protein